MFPLFRCETFGNWLGSVEKLMKEMAQEDMTGEEYRDKLAKFQVKSLVDVIFLFTFIADLLE